MPRSAVEAAATAAAATSATVAYWQNTHTGSKGACSAAAVAATVALAPETDSWPRENFSVVCVCLWWSLACSFGCAHLVEKFVSELLCHERQPKALLRLRPLMPLVVNLHTRLTPSSESICLAEIHSYSARRRCSRHLPSSGRSTSQRSHSNNNGIKLPNKNIIIVATATTTNLSKYLTKLNKLIAPNQRLASPSSINLHGEYCRRRQSVNVSFRACNGLSPPLVQLSHD